jgi:hypothetical protein
LSILYLVLESWLIIISFLLQKKQVNLTGDETLTKNLMYSMLYPLFKSNIFNVTYKHGFLYVGSTFSTNQDHFYS